MEQVWTAILSAATGSLITFIGIIANNRHALNVMRAQWEREDRKAREEQRRQYEREVDAARAKEREKIQEVYATAIEAVSHYIAEKEVGTTATALVNAKSAAERALAVAVVYYHDKTSAKYTGFANSVNGGLEDSAEYIYNELYQVIAYDPRLR